MEGDYFFTPRDWNIDKELAVIEVNDFMARYLSDLNLGSISNSFKEIVELEEPTYLSGFTSVKTWIEFWEYYITCETIKLSKAMMNPEFPPDFPPLDYYTLNKIVFHYLLDVNLVEEARTFALHTSDDNPDGIDYVDYTVVQSVREFIVPFTAYISEYSPNSEAGKTFLIPSSSEENVDEHITEQQSRPPKPGGSSKLPQPPQLYPYLDDHQLIDSNVMSLLTKMPSEVTEQCQPQPQLPRPQAPLSFRNLDPLIDRVLSLLQAESNYIPQLLVPSSLALTGGHELPDFTKLRKPPPLPPKPPRPKGKPPRSSPYLDQLIDVKVKSSLPTELSYIPPQVVPSSYSSLTLTGELKQPEVTKQRKPPPLPPKPPRPKEKPPRSSPYLDQLIDVNAKSLLPTELSYIPPQVVPSSYSSQTLTGELKPPEVTKQRKPPLLPPKPPRPKGKPPRPPPFLDQLIDVNVQSLLPTELDYISLPVETISSDSLLTLTGEQKTSELTEQPESPPPQPSPHPESSLEGTENYSTSDFDEHLPPSKIRREQSGD